MAEVEIIGYQYSDRPMTVVRSIDRVHPTPFYRPGTLFSTDLAVVPTSSVIVTLEQGTGPVIELADPPDAERRDDADCIRYAGAPHAG